MGLLDTALAAAGLYYGGSALLGAIGGDAAAATAASTATSAASASSLAPYLSAGATYLGAQMNNNTAMSIAQQNMAFSANQAATIYSRGAQDLANAGINPIIAYSSPAGMAQAVTPNIQPSLSLAAGAYNSASEVNASNNLKNTQASSTAALTPEQIKAIAADVSLKQSHERLSNAQTASELTKPDLIKSQIQLNSASAFNMYQQAATSAAEKTLKEFQTRLVDKQTSGAEALRFLTLAQTDVQNAIKARTIDETTGQKIRNQLDSAELTIKNKKDVAAVLNHEDTAVIGQALHNALRWLPFTK